MQCIGGKDSAYSTKQMVTWNKLVEEEQKILDSLRFSGKLLVVVFRTLLETFLFHDKFNEVDCKGCMILSSWRFLELPCQNARGSNCV